MDDSVEHEILQYINQTSNNNAEVEAARVRLNETYPALLRLLLEEGLGRRSDNLKARAAYLANLANVVCSRYSYLPGYHIIG